MVGSRNEITSREQWVAFLSNQHQLTDGAKIELYCIWYKVAEAIECSATHSVLNYLRPHGISAISFALVSHLLTHEAQHSEHTEMDSSFFLSAVFLPAVLSQTPSVLSRLFRVEQDPPLQPNIPIASVRDAPLLLQLESALNAEGADHESIILRFHVKAETIYNRAKARSPISSIIHALVGTVALATNGASYTAGLLGYAGSMFFNRLDRGAVEPVLNLLYPTGTNQTP